MRNRLGILATAACLIAGLSGAAIADPGGAPAPGSRASATAQDARADQADAALAKVAELFSGPAAGTERRSQPGNHADGRGATLALRDLAALKDSLTGADREAAERFLARPTDGGGDPEGDGYTVAEAAPACGTYVCVHYVTSTVDAVSLTDTSPVNGIPDYVETARDALDLVHATYVGAGYKAPKGDLTRGGDARTDIYLSDLATQTDALYGYCTTDDPGAGQNGVYDVWAYCVLENDYAEFPGVPLDNLKVTSAHEYFHAVQFAYDWLEDGWFIEASATWAEDELFDGVNDNVAYLTEGQLGRPWIPLDAFGDLIHYGNWIFLRFLTEKYATELGGMPKLMRDLWDKVDAAEPTDPDMYGIQAIKSLLASKNTSFAAQYALFADAGRRRDAFDEGKAQGYPVKPVAGRVKLSTSKKTSGWLTVKQDHLTSATLRVEPTDTLKASAWRLRVQLDMPPTRRGTAAVVTVYKQGGGVVVSRLNLSSEGNKTVAVKFGKSDVKAVEVTMVNASTRFDCWLPPYNSPFSCLGQSKDDALKPLVRVTAFR